LSSDASRSRKTAGVAAFWIDRKPRMRMKKVSMFLSMRILPGFFLLLAAATVASSQGTTDFSGVWSIQKPTTDGNGTVATGADGGEFKTSVVWKDSNLFFSIEEQEEGRILQPKQTWSVIDDGATLKRMGEPQCCEKQTLFFRRMPLSCCESKSGFIKAHDK
jgi:hypothetical protein